MDIKLYDSQESTDQENVNKTFKFKKLFLIILCIMISIILVIVYCRYKATSGLKINEYKVVSSNLPDSFHGVKVVQFSDIYFGNTVDIKYLENICNSINSLKPDIVVFTGDFTGNSIDDETKDSIIKVLSSINPIIGKYAISGDIDDSNLFNELFSASGFINLDGTNSNIYYKDNDYITIGTTDSSSDLFDILLLHKPDDIMNYGSSFDLVLAGHSLNGQINIPFLKNLFLMNGSHKYYNGYYSVNGSNLYVSNGIGTTNFKYRFNNKPSISLYRLAKY